MPKKGEREREKERKSTASVLLSDLNRMDQPLCVNNCSFNEMKLQIKNINQRVLGKNRSLMAFSKILLMPEKCISSKSKNQCVLATTLYFSSLLSKMLYGTDTHTSTAICAGDI